MANITRYVVKLGVANWRTSPAVSSEKAKKKLAHTR
jgi:hypothetical protein